MTDIINLANYQRVSEAPATAAEWTPRAALIDMLADIDSGKVSPEHLIICYTEPECLAAFVSATASKTTAIGILATVQHVLLSGE